MSRLAHGLLAAAALCSALATGPPVGAAGAAPRGDMVSEDDYRLLSLRLGQLVLADALEGYSTRGGSGLCVDLGQLAAALDFPIRVDAETGTAEGWFRSEDSRFSLDLNAGTAQGETLAPGLVRRSPQGFCVDTGLAARWFGLTLAPDLANAVLVAASADKLPVELAAERKLRQARMQTAAPRDLSRLPRAVPPYAMWRTPALDLVASAGYVDDKVRADRRAFGQYELYATGEAARLSYDARFASNDEAEPESVRVRAFRKSVDADLLGPLRATEFALGDVVSYASALTAENSYGRGAYVTNQPLGRPQTFDRTEFRGELPAGWDAELYRNGQLIAFSDSRADGRYAFEDVALLFGVNRFEIVLYGPQGQVRRERRTVNVGMDSVPAGKTYYWVGALEDQKDLFTLKDIPRIRDDHPLRASAVVEHGIDRRTSVSLQLHSLAPGDDDRLTYVEGSVRRIVGGAVLQLDLASDLEGGVALGGQIVAQLGEDTYLTAQSLWAHAFVSDRVEEGLRSRHALALDHFFDVAGTVVPVGVRVAYNDWRGMRADTVEVATRISAQLSGLSLTYEVNWQHFSGARGAGGDLLTTSLLAGGRIGDTRLRGEARYRLRPERELESVSLVAEWGLDERSDLRGELIYEAPFDRARLGLGYSHRFDRLALGARAEAATDGSVAAGISLAVSFGPDAGGRFARVTSEKLASAGQAAARVFTDTNRDGHWEAGEPVHEGVSVAAGTAVADDPTGKTGLAIIDGLRAYDPQLISVDATTLVDPLLKPAVPGVVVVPRPGVMAAVELPLLPTGEIEGMLYMDGGAGPKALAGADLQLVGETGQVTATTHSDFDGFFLFESVLYGRYTIRLSPEAAAMLDTARRPLASVVVDDRTPVVNAGSVTLPSRDELALFSETGRQIESSETTFSPGARSAQAAPSARRKR